MSYSRFVNAQACCLMLMLTFGMLQAQYPKKMGSKVMEYTFVGEGGTESASVVWIPGANMYITAIAGSEMYPMEGFSARGTNMWSQESGFDVRGLWYNPKTKRLEGNAAGEEGWFFQLLDANGETIGSPKKFLPGRNQPDDASVLTSTNKLIIGYEDGVITHYTLAGKYKKRYQLILPEDEEGNLLHQDFNTTTIAATGVATFPLALLDVSSGGILFVGLKGEYLFFTKLPQDALLPGSSRFSFANQFCWIFDDERRTWTAYKVFH